MSEREWNTVWGILRGAYPTLRFDDPAVESVWRLDLEDLNPDDAIAAIRQEHKNSDEIITVAAIRRGANGAARDRRLAQDAEHLKLDTPTHDIPPQYTGRWEEVQARMRGLSAGMSMEAHSAPVKEDSRRVHADRTSGSPARRPQGQIATRS